MTPRLHSECCPLHSGTSRVAPGEGEQRCCVGQRKEALRPQSDLEEMPVASAHLPSPLGSVPPWAWQNHQLQEAAQPQIPGWRELLSCRHPAAGLLHLFIHSSNKHARSYSRPYPFLAKPETAGSPPNLSGPLGPALHPASLHPISHKPQPGKVPM